jgi:hypothetical protein
MLFSTAISRVVPANLIKPSGGRLNLLAVIAFASLSIVHIAAGCEVVVNGTVINQPEPTPAPTLESVLVPTIPDSYRTFVGGMGQFAISLPPGWGVQDENYPVAVPGSDIHDYRMMGGKMPFLDDDRATLIRAGTERLSVPRTSEQLDQASIRKTLIDTPEAVVVKRRQVAVDGADGRLTEYVVGDLVLLSLILVRPLDIHAWVVGCSYAVPAPAEVREECETSMMSFRFLDSQGGQF